MTPILRVNGLSASIGHIPVLRGVDLPSAARRDGRAARPQRRRQDVDAARDPRAAAAQGRTGVAYKGDDLDAPARASRLAAKASATCRRAAASSRT